MKVKARVLQTEITDGKFLARIQLNGKLPKKGSIITCHWGAQRSEEQNRYYFAYLSWLINEGGMRELGHFSVDALHQNFKSHFLAEKAYTKDGFKAIEEATTTNLHKNEFAEYISKIDNLVNDFMGIDTSPFHKEYEEYYGRY